MDQMSGPRNALSWYRGKIAPGAATPLQLIMVQSTPFCNIDCSYCYLSHRSMKARFDLDRLSTLIERLDEAGLLAGKITMLWHAGEPLVLPQDYYRRADEILKAHTPAGVTFVHNFQTNATLVNAEWCELFHSLKASVGVSIDGPQDIHDARRVTRDGKGTFARSLAGYETLKAAGIRAPIIAVLTDRSLGEPDRIYAFFKGLEPLNVGFNVEEIEGVNVKSSLAADGMRDKVRGFYTRLLQLARQDPQPLRIRELDNGRSALSGSIMANDCFSSENNPLSILSVGVKGHLATFSPELLQSDEGPDKYTFATIEDVDFTRLYDNPRFREMNDPIQAGVAACRASCPYFAMCGGGAPSNKVAEHGRFDATETMSCRLHNQALADVFDAELAARIAARQRHAGITVATKPATKTLRLVPASKPMLRHAPTFPAAGTVAVLCPPDRIEVSSGTAAPETEGFDPALFKADVFVARAPWRRLTPQEAEQVTARPVSGPQFIGLVRLPEALARQAKRLGHMAVAMIDRPLDRGDAFAALEADIYSQLRLLFDGGDAARLLGVQVSLTGLPALTTDYDDPLLWGLHVDSWFKQPVDGRRGTFGRMGVNIGVEPRRIQIIDIGLDRIVDMVPGGRGMSAYDLGRAFMRLYPDYPVLAVTVRPGEAYIAPTENVIHDGNSVDMAAPDVLLTWLGNFTPSILKQHEHF